MYVALRGKKEKGKEPQATQGGRLQLSQHSGLFQGSLFLVLKEAAMME